GGPPPHPPTSAVLALIEPRRPEPFHAGAIGSRPNSEPPRARLREHFDLGEAALGRLHGPAGLYIGSRTPAEIALSILAEVVAAKNGARLPAGAGVAGGKAQAEATVSPT
ncbi:XdhC family protein, partial [Sphaerotilus natans]|uniref:XdhC family protein n=1 Tax=Sphaerotilus natans TaxID=34103 RepID=UPI000568A84B